MRLMRQRWRSSRDRGARKAAPAVLQLLSVLLCAGRIQAKRAKLETGDFKQAGEDVQNTVQPDAPQQTVAEALKDV